MLQQGEAGEGGGEGEREEGDEGQKGAAEPSQDCSQVVILVRFGFA